MAYGEIISMIDTAETRSNQFAKAIQEPDKNYGI
jgi:hypothetical protein